jgi:hypothetical protein
LIVEVPHQNNSIFLQQQPWQREIEAAVNELDSEKLLQRVHVAEAEIFNRLQQLGLREEDASTQAERRAIADALKTLLIVKRDRLGFSGCDDEES